MPTDELTTYLNDHMAGAVAALTMLERLIATSDEGDERRFFDTLKRDIDEDKATLEGLIERAGGHRSVVREAGAWMTEKFVAVKMRLDDPGGRRLNYFEALETLGLGILGKRALWRVLRAIPTIFRICAEPTSSGSSTARRTSTTASKRVGSPPAAGSSRPPATRRSRGRRERDALA